MRAATGPPQLVVDEETPMDETGRLRWVAAALSALGAVAGLALTARRSVVPDPDIQATGSTGSGTLEGAAA